MPRSVGRSWTPRTTTIFLTMAREGHTHREIARRLRRTRKCVSNRAYTLRKRLIGMPWVEVARLLDPSVTAI